MWYGFRGIQGSYKSLSMIILAHHLVERPESTYKWNDVYGNLELSFPGYNYLPNDQLFDFIKKVGRTDESHYIFLLDELDNFASSRLYSVREQTELLTPLWQDEKKFLHILYTCHLGSSVDKIVRDATMHNIIPKYDSVNDILYWYDFDKRNFINGDIKPTIYAIHNPSRYFPCYNRWGTIKR